MFGGNGDEFPDKLKELLEDKLEMQYETEDLPVDWEKKEELILRGYRLLDEIGDVEIVGNDRRLHHGVRPINESQPFEMLRLLFVIEVEDVTMHYRNVEEIRELENFNTDTDTIQWDEGNLSVLLKSDSYEPDEDEKPSEEEKEAMKDLPDNVEIMGGMI